MGEVGRSRILNEFNWSREAPKLLAAYEQASMRKAMLRQYGA
jgi:hypothetical protein